MTTTENKNTANKTKSRFNKELLAEFAIVALNGVISGIAVAAGSAAMSRVLTTKANPSQASDSNIIPMKKTTAV